MTNSVINFPSSGGTSIGVILGVVFLIVALAYIIYNIYSTIHHVYINNNGSFDIECINS